jgi:hypothetical protein
MAVPNKIYAMCTVKVTDGDIIERLIDILEVDTVMTKVNRKNPKWKPAFEFRLYNQKAIALSEQLYPYLSERRKRQIDRMKMFHAMDLDVFLRTENTKK